MNPTKTANITMSRNADKFVVRMPDGMRDRLDAYSDEHHTSMNSTAVQGIESFLDGHARLKDLLDGVELLRKQLEFKTQAIDQERAEIAELKSRLEAGSV
ncbi:Arc family DNA-binding protein [Pseudomonas tritici]|uniref:Arc family DNA-binding protein n=1 Tax=Pseudomonas tritici TaxID=2745518 RepID=UPI00387B98AC